MGVLTLSNLQSDIEASIGNRTLDPGRLTRMINFAYMEIEGAVDFVELNIEESFVLADATEEYAIPATIGNLALISVPGAGKEGVLTFRWPAEYYRQAAEQEEGQPQIWTVIGRTAKVYPIPNGADNALMFGKREITLLAGANDVTILPNTWDPGIYLLATSYVLGSLGEDARSANWYSRAVNYMASRVIDEDRAVRGNGDLAKAVSNAMRQ